MRHISSRRARRLFSGAGRTVLRFFGFAVGCAVLYAPSALAADVNTGWGSWWLPPNHSAHGGDIDMLFNWIFWITMVAFILVEAVLA